MRQAILLVHADRLSDKVRKRNKRLLLTIEILGEFYCDLSYYASSNTVSSC